MQSLYLKYSLFDWVAGAGCCMFPLIVRIPLFLDARLAWYTLVLLLQTSPLGALKFYGNTALCSCPFKRAQVA